MELIVASASRTHVQLPHLSRRAYPGAGRRDGAAHRHSAIPGEHLILERFRDGRRLSREVRTADGSASLLEIPVTSAQRGGFTVVRDHQLMTSGVNIQVPWDDRVREVSFSTFRDKIGPAARRPGASR